MKKIILSILAMLLPMLASADNEEQVFYPRRVVMEEATGTWCGWCVRGIETIDRMKQEYPDNFIAIAIHAGDEMEDVENYKFLMDKVPGYPSCFINRSAYDVSYDIAKNAVTQNKDNGIAKIESNAAFTDGSRTSVSVSTETVFGFTPSSSSYKISYVVVEDSVGPYAQENYYSGNSDFSDPNNYMYEWYLKPARVAVVFNDVARGIYEDTNSGNFPGQIQKGTPYQNSFTFQLPFNIGDKDHIRIVVLLIDQQTGEIVNASQSSVTGDKDPEQPLHDGDTFVAKSIEGINITFTVISEAEKTCKVGTGIEEAAIDIYLEGFLTIPASVNGYTVVSIGAYAFNFCVRINGYNLPNTIKTIEPSAFAYNRSLKEIDIPESVDSIMDSVFFDCSELTHVSFHEGLKYIGDHAFGYTALTSIDLPRGLEYIDFVAFIAPLATVVVRSSVPIPVQVSCFDDDIYMRTTLYVPEGTKNSFKADKEWGQFRVIKEGEPRFERPTDIACPEDFGRQYIVYGEPVTINVNFQNMRSNPISTISYIPTIDGVEGEEQTYEFPQPIAADGQSFNLPVTLPNFNEPITKTVFLDITKMNGVPIEYGADIRSNVIGSAAVFNPVSDHRILIKDFTHPACPWALRANVGFEKLKERYGDKVIRASFDIGGPMWCEPLLYNFFTPTCIVDDNFDTIIDIDPYYGEGTTPLGILDYVERIMTKPHFGNLKILSAQWANADQTEINVVTEASLGMTETVNYLNSWKIPYFVEFILVEDSLKGDGAEWEQINGYAGMTLDDPNLQPLTELPYIITDMVYRDIAVGQYQDLNVLYLGHYTYGKPQQLSYTLRLSELTQSIIQDKRQLSVIALLRDGSNFHLYGDLVDSDKSKITAYSSDVKGIRQNAATHDVFDLSGRKVKAAASTLDDLPKGVYIYDGKKVVIGR